MWVTVEVEGHLKKITDIEIATWNLPGYTYLYQGVDTSSPTGGSDGKHTSCLTSTLEGALWSFFNIA